MAGGGHLPVVVLRRVNPGHHKVDLLRAIRSIDDGTLADAQQLVARVLAGAPVHLELPSDAAADRFLTEITRAGAEAERVLDADPKPA